MTDSRETVAGVFERSAPTYDAVGVAFFTDVGRRLVALADVQPGERVVDLGCGRGAALFPAATAVGPTGTVLGIDLAPTMVALTRADARVRGLANVSVEMGDAQEPGLTSGRYDVVLSSLTVFLLPDPLAGLRAWRDAVVDGGRLALTTFAGRDDPRWAWLSEIFPSRDPAASTLDREAGSDEDTGPFSSSERLHELLAEAGWRDATSDEQDHDVRFADADQWVDWSWSHGMRMYWERMAESDRPAAEAAARERLQAMEADGLVLRIRVRYTTATAG
jgi:ubiquinone/menaquinone biosynthesis C-methylase UbiE